MRPEIAYGYGRLIEAVLESKLTEEQASFLFLLVGSLAPGQDFFHEITHDLHYCQGKNLRRIREARLSRPGMNHPWPFNRRRKCSGLAKFGAADCGNPAPGIL